MIAVLLYTDFMVGDTLVEHFTDSISKNFYNGSRLLKKLQHENVERLNCRIVT